MFYTVYKITNLVNNKIYIGVHKTKDLNDNYMGSGIIIKKAQKKYGIENFEKEILYFLDTEKDMYLKEKEIVDEDFVLRKDNYNIKEGGQGGWDHLKDFMKSESHKLQYKLFLEKGRTIAKEKRNYLFNNNAEWVEKCSKSISDALKEYYKNGGKGSFTGKTHTEEVKRKIGEANSKHQSGEGNSQFGKMWIYNLELKESKKINKDEIIPEGWIKGRKIKF